MRSPTPLRTSTWKTVATVAAGAVGAAFAAVPFLASWKPSARAKAMGAPIEVDVSKLEPGALLKVEWRGKAVYVVHRTPEMLAALKGVGATAGAKAAIEAAGGSVAE